MLVKATFDSRAQNSMKFPQLVAFWSPMWMMLCDHTTEVAQTTKGKNFPFTSPPDKVEIHCCEA